MGLIVGLLKCKKAKVISLGETLEIMTLLTTISKFLVQKIAKEKGISVENAEKIVVDCINEGIKTVKER